MLCVSQQGLWSGLNHQINNNSWGNIVQYTRNIRYLNETFLKDPKQIREEWSKICIAHEQGDVIRKVEQLKELIELRDRYIRRYDGVVNTTKECNVFIHYLCTDQCI